MGKVPVTAAGRFRRASSELATHGVGAVLRRACCHSCAAATVTGENHLLAYEPTVDGPNDRRGWFRSGGEGFEDWVSWSAPEGWTDDLFLSLVENVLSRHGLSVERPASRREAIRVTMGVAE